MIQIPYYHSFSISPDYMLFLFLKLLHLKSKIIETFCVDFHSITHNNCPFSVLGMSCYHKGMKTLLNMTIVQHIIIVGHPKVQQYFISFPNKDIEIHFPRDIIHHIFHCISAIFFAIKYILVDVFFKKGYIQITVTCMHQLDMGTSRDTWN